MENVMKTFRRGLGCNFINFPSLSILPAFVAPQAIINVFPAGDFIDFLSVLMPPAFFAAAVCGVRQADLPCSVLGGRIGRFA
jgi:hypothetical protein